jgi:hypothetical protein
MELLFRVAAGLFIVTSIGCVILFVLQMTLLKKSDWVYERLYDRCRLWRGGRSGANQYDSRWQEYIETSYGTLVGIGFLLLIGAGTHQLLWWMPNRWGWHDGGGDWTTLRFTLAIISALFVGGPILSMLMEYVRSRMQVKLLREDIRDIRQAHEDYVDEAEWYSKLNNTADVGVLQLFQSQLEAKLAALVAPEAGKNTRWYRDLRRYDHLRFAYAKLIEATKDKLKELHPHN